MAENESNFPLIIFLRDGYQPDPITRQRAYLMFIKDSGQLPTGVPFMVILTNASEEDFGMAKIIYRRMI